MIAKNLLPIGSVVKLNKADKRLMVMGVAQMNADGEEYDYIGVFYPEGYIDDETIFMFNHDDVERVDFLGYVDSECQVFRKQLFNHIKSHEND